MQHQQNQNQIESEELFQKGLKFSFGFGKKSGVNRVKAFQCFDKAHSK